jgi:DNA-binding CsgD family transcriptional regulator
MLEQCPLTGRELQAVEGLASGHTIQQIADERGVCLQTIKSQLTAAYRHLGVASRAQAVLACQRNRWIASPNPSQTYDVLLAHIARATEELCGLLHQRRKLTAPQSAYLDAFDDLLYARTEPEQIRARQAMDEALGPVLLAGAVTPENGQKRDLVELLVAYVSRSR